MKITSINIVHIPQGKGMLGFANIIIDNLLEISSIGLYMRLDGQGLRLTWPAKKLGDGNYKYFAKPIDSAFQDEIVKAIEAEMEKLGIYKFKTKNEIIN